MANPLGMAVQLTQSAARIGWYLGVNALAEQRARRLGHNRTYTPQRPVPTRAALLRSLGDLLLEDARAVRDGLYPPMEAEDGPLPQHIRRVSAMLADLPAALARREDGDADSARAEPSAVGLPDYYTQDFHFQSGGYLSEESARLYDVQVETLFYGSANAMRRAALPFIARHMAGRDQRRMHLVDVACGTGRLLRQVRLACPALQLTGLDLSQSYLDEAAAHMGRLRPARLLAANAEDIPLENASADIVTTVFLFHELPPEVRRRVAAEMARVLKPGGLLVFADSLQMGDRPDWDGLLEAFPVRFHEPYYRHYAIDDLAAVFEWAGLTPVETRLAFLAKVMAWRKPG